MTREDIEALAERFAKRHANELRYVRAWRAWLRLVHGKWRVDNELHAFHCACMICNEAYVEGHELKIARIDTAVAVERLARENPRLAASTEEQQGLKPRWRRPHRRTRPRPQPVVDESGL